VKVELTPDAAQWVEAELAAGRFSTPEDAVRYAINRAKRAELREMLDSAEAEGGSHTSEEVRRRVRDHLDQLSQTPKAS
jgi:Arc/MetJ-type ribon-helix-helix transcriptional regulator